MAQPKEEKIEQVLSACPKTETRETDETSKTSGEAGSPKPPTHLSPDGEASGHQGPTEWDGHTSFNTSPEMREVWMADDAAMYPGPDSQQGSDLAIEMGIEGWSPLGPG